MKVVIAAAENRINSLIDQHFGRCKLFYVYDTINQTGQFIENTSHLQTDRAGCDAAGVMMEMGVEMVVAGRFGSKVTSIFRSKNIQQVVINKPVTINNFIQQLK